MSYACPECAVLDALGRHDPMCQRAVRLGLERLAEGEVPIPPGEGTATAEPPELTEDDESGTSTDEYDALPATAGQAGSGMDGTPPASAPTPQPVTANELDRIAPQLWLAYLVDVNGHGYDAVVFVEELAALRWAVREGWKVMHLELGRPIRRLIEEAHAG